MERMINEIIDRIQRIEELLSSISGEEARYASRLIIGLSMPPLYALESARRLISLLHGSFIEVDEISMTILETLSGCEPLNISEITRRVRRLRGRASRRIVRSRLERLVEEGVVKRISRGGRSSYILVNCIDENIDRG